MARNIDTSKMENIRKATINVVVEEGIKNASVAKIAKEAKVSAGYLYRFHPSKEELIQVIFKDLFQEIVQRLQILLEKEDKLHEVFRLFILDLFNQAKINPNEPLFMLKLMTDYSFRMDEQDKQVLNEIGEKMLSIGYSTKEINPSIDSEMLYTLFIGTTYFFINVRERKIFNSEKLSKKDAEKITQLYINALA
ncbi:TetR/AcrR family transcriptional regulator [Weeksellaceae bacterium TAE3-ERU29]|nr:TetR/AcrR family transcriptional regulator [Weeksellaceae bacterium TAE3-ERU29]